jgi:uncharacterized membrane protein YkoI
MYQWQTAALALAIMICDVLPVSAQVPPLPSAQAANQPLSTQVAPSQLDARLVTEVKCWADWSEAAVIVRREALMPVERVSKMAGAKHPDAEVIKVTLCEDQGKFVYRLLLRERQGQLKSEVLDAR